MTRRIMVELVFVALGCWAAACGRVEQPLGNLPEQNIEPSGGGAPDSGSDSNSIHDCPYSQSFPVCYDSCESGLLVQDECVGKDNVPVCPGGAVTADQCPLESCVSGAYCCDPNGVFSMTRCNDVTHQLEGCPNGGHLTTGTCLPEGLTAHACWDLKDQACASTDYHCYDGSSAICSCAVFTGQTEPRWNCFHPTGGQ